MADLTPTQLALIGAGIVALIGYCVLILAPAWGSYGRVWERIAASFLTIYILAALVGIGAVIGAAIVWTYDNWG